MRSRAECAASERMPRLPVVRRRLSCASDQESGNTEFQPRRAFGAHGIGRIKGRSPGHGEIIAVTWNCAKQNQPLLVTARGLPAGVSPPSSKAVLAVPDRHTVSLSVGRDFPNRNHHKITIPQGTPSLVLFGAFRGLSKSTSQG